MNNSMSQNNRIQGIDLLKCLAIIAIPSQHFFTLNTHFRDVEFDTLSMFLQSIAMEIALIGVPLFIAITGYLSQQTEPTWQYYKKSLRVIIPYIIISIVYLLFRKYILGENFGLFDATNMILGFSAISYAWYIKMWIGLYLLAPFLNILYNNIKSPKTSLILIATLYVMTYLTATVNREGFHILPDYWVDISPLTAYFIGSHIRKFGFKSSSKKILIFIMFTIITEPLINMMFFHNQSYRYIVGTYLLIVPEMAAIFILLHKWSTKNIWLKRVISLISDHTLEMYLYCAMCDIILYPFFMKWYVTQSQFGIFFFIIIPLELIATFCLAWFTDKFLTVIRIDRLWKISKSQKV